MKKEINKKKILFLDHTPFIGGAQISLLQQLKKLDKNKLDFFVACSDKAREIGLCDRFSKIGVDCRILPLERLKIWSPVVFFRFFLSASRLRNLVNKEGVDIVFCNTVRTSIISALVLFFSKSKLIWFLQDYTFPRALFFFLKFIPNRIIYVSTSVRDFYSSAGEVVYNGSDIYERFSSLDSGDIQDKRKELGVKNDDVLLGYVGRLVSWKGAFVLLEAVNKLIKDGVCNIRCVLVGTGDNQDEDIEQELKDYVVLNGLEDSVVFTGYQEDIALYMKAIDIFCLTSIEPEPFGLVLVEAMMSGAVVISSNLGGPREIIKNGENGFLVESGDCVELAEILKKVISNQELRRKIVPVSYDYAIKNYSLDVFVKRMELIFQDL